MPRPSCFPTHARQQGAALLLLLLVLGMGTAALLISAFSRDNGSTGRDIETLSQMELAKSALLGYAQLNGYLPSPAASPTAGTASPQLCAANASCTGYIPWVTLGITGSDSWGKLLRYSVTAELTHAPVLRLQAVADRRILGRNPNGDLVYLGGQERCSLARQCVAAVILSNGKRNFGTSLAGITLANGGINNIDEIRNSSAVRDFISRQATGDTAIPGGEFDDLLVWIPLTELYLHMNRTGKLP